MQRESHSAACECDQLAQVFQNYGPDILGENYCQQNTEAQWSNQGATTRSAVRKRSHPQSVGKSHLDVAFTQREGWSAALSSGGGGKARGKRGGRPDGLLGVSPGNAPGGRL